MASKDTFLDRLLAEQKEIRDGLVETPAQSLEEYHRRVGKHIGLQTAIDIMLEIMRGDERDDN